MKPRWLWPGSTVTRVILRARWTWPTLMLSRGPSEPYPENWKPAPEGARCVATTRTPGHYRIRVRCALEADHGGKHYGRLMGRVLEWEDEKP